MTPEGVTGMIFGFITVSAIILGAIIKFRDEMAAAKSRITVLETEVKMLKEDRHDIKALLERMETRLTESFTNLKEDIHNVALKLEQRIKH